MTVTDGTHQLAALRGGCTPEQAFDLFDELPTVSAADLTGRWRGAELRTGHPFDGLLTAVGWYGKQFDTPDDVHPLLFSVQGDIFPVEPRRAPFSLAGRVPLAAAAQGAQLLKVAKPLVRTTKPRARLRNLDYRGKTSAAMIYDHLPIIDIFRAVNDHTLLGVMDMRDLDQPYFFILERDKS